MFLRRYRLIVVLAVPLGFVLGALLFVVMAFTGNPDWRAHLTVSEIGRNVVMYGLIGLVVAVCAAAGGVIAVTMKDRQFRRQRSVRIRWAAIGAAAGVVLLGIGSEIIASLARTSSGWGADMIYLMSFFLAVPAAIVAAALVAVAENRAARQLMPRTEITYDQSGA